jgi:hypothetical protein
MKRGVKLWWGCTFLIAVLDWLSSLTCVSDSWAKCRQEQSIIFFEKGNYCFVEVTYTDGSWAPARPAALL